MSQHRFPSYVAGQIMEAPIERENRYGQAGEPYRTMPDWERENLVLNLIDAFRQCDELVRERMVFHCEQGDRDFGARVTAGLGGEVPEMATTRHD